jgi:hypothetical protein
MIFPIWTLKTVKSTFGMEYNQRVIIKFLWKEEINARDIAGRLHAQFGEHAYQLRTVQFWIREIQLGHQNLHNEIRTGRPPFDDLGAKVLAILDKYPFEFESSHSISERLLVAHPTVLPYLHDFIGFKSFHLHLVPHLWTDDLREKRKEHARVMLSFLQIVKRDG